MSLRPDQRQAAAGGEAGCGEAGDPADRPSWPPTPEEQAALDGLDASHWCVPLLCRMHWSGFIWRAGV